MDSSYGGVDKPLHKRGAAVSEVTTLSPPISAADKAKARKELADSVGMGEVIIGKMM